MNLSPLNESTLRALASQRDPILRSDLDDLGVRSQMSPVFYSRQLGESRNICEALAKDPYKISRSDTVADIITLPCFETLMDKAFELVGAEEDLEEPGEELSFFLSKIIELCGIVIKTMVPVIEDIIRFEGSKTIKSSKADFVKQLLEGIPLDSKGSKLVIEVGDFTTEFSIVRGTQKLSFQTGNQGQYNFTFFDNKNEKERSIKFDFNEDNGNLSLLSYPNITFESGGECSEIFGFDIKGDESHLSNLFIPNTFKQGGLVSKFVN